MAIDDARADLLEKVWATIIAKKMGMVAALEECRKEIRTSKNVTEVLRRIEKIEVRLELLDEIVSEASSK